MDINQIKRELEKRKVAVDNFYKPKNGDVVRLVVLKQGDNVDYKICIVPKHVIPGYINVVCGKENCIICDKREELRNSITQWNDFNKSIIKSLYPRDERYAMFFIKDRVEFKEDVGKIKWMKLNNDAWNSLTTFITNCWDENVDQSKIDLTVSCNTVLIDGSGAVVCKGFIPNIKEKDYPPYDEAIKNANEIELGLQGINDKTIESLSKWLEDKYNNVDNSNSIGHDVTNKLNELLKKNG